jgi:hypothetical protein
MKADFVSAEATTHNPQSVLQAATSKAKSKFRNLKFETGKLEI